MRNILTISLICILGIQLASGQHHIKNQKFFDFSIGAYDTFKGSLALGFKIGKYNKNLNSYQIGFQYKYKLAPAQLSEISSLNFSVPVSQYMFDYTADFNIIKNINSTRFFRFTTGAIAGFESINNEKTYINQLLIAQKSDIVLGVKLGVEAEFSPFILGVSEHINLLSNYSKFSTMPYIGIRLHLKN